MAAYGEFGLAAVSGRVGCVLEPLIDMNEVGRCLDVLPALGA
jgi:hypothetical protein